MDNYKIICPKCNSIAKNVQTKYGLRSHCCNLWSWKGAPLVDRETHITRMTAHKHFDVLWKSGILTRSEAYEWLSRSLNIPKEECHMKIMQYNMAKKVIRLCRNFIILP